MPDSVKIAIESTYSGQGVNQAIGDLTKLEGLEKFSRQSAANWQKLDQSVDSARKTLAMTNEEWKRNVWNSLSFGEKAGVVTTRLHEMAKGAQTFALNFGGAALAIGAAGKQVYEFGKAGAQIEYTREKFDRLAKSVGTTGEIFLRDLRGATRGTVSDFELLKQGSDLLQLGLAKDAEEATRLSKVMTALGMDTGELTLALANQSKRRLDQLGLSLSKFNEIESKLKDKGLTKEDAFKEAFLQTAEQTVNITGNRADSSMGNYLRMEAELKNLINEYKMGLSDAKVPLFGNQSFSATVGQLAQTLSMLRQVSSPNYGMANPEWDANTNRVLFDVQRQYEYFSQAQRGTGSGFGIAASVNTPGGRGRQAKLIANDYAQMAAYYQRTQAGGGEVAAAAAPLDYASMIAGGLDLTKMTEAYAEKTAELNDKLFEESERLEDITRKYGENSDQVADQRDKINDVRSAISELNEDMEASAESWALGMMKSKGATEEMQYEFAEASGLISEDAAELYKANDQLYNAWSQGKLSAEDYAYAVSNLSSKVSGLSGMQVSAYVDVFIRTHGKMPPGGWTGDYQDPTAPAVPPKPKVPAHASPGTFNKWTGGALEDGWTIVGDMPGGNFGPHTEAIFNGWVFDAQTTKMLKEAGILDGAPGLAGGSYTPFVDPKRLRVSGPRRNQRLRNRPRVGSMAAGAPSAMGGGDAESSALPEPDTSAAEAAMQVSAQSQEQSAQSFENAANQQVQAQQQSSEQIVAKLDEVLEAINRLPDKNDAYANARAPQMNI